MARKIGRLTTTIKKRAIYRLSITEWIVNHLLIIIPSGVMPCGVITESAKIRKKVSGFRVLRFRFQGTEPVEVPSVSGLQCSIVNHVNRKSICPLFVQQVLLT